MGQLRQDELESLYRALLGAFPDPADFAIVVNFSLDKSFDLFGDKGFSIKLLDIIRYASAQHQAEKLIVKAMEANKGNTILQQNVDRILRRLRRQSMWPEPDDSFEVCFVDDDKPFLDRGTFRDFFRNMRDPAEPAVCIVNGRSACGKTYSVELVRYLRSRREDFVLAHVDSKGFNYADFKPELLIRNIVEQAGWKAEPPSQASSAARYAKELCQWLLGQASNAPLPLVIVLDNFHEPQLDGETREFIQEMMLQISTPLPAEDRRAAKVRLVLLNYPREMEPKILPGPLRRQFVDNLTKADIREFFAKLAEQKGKPTPDPEALTSIADFAWSKMQSGVSNETVRAAVLQTAIVITKF